MKAAFTYTLLIIASLAGTTVLAQSTCSNGGGNQPGIAPFVPQFPVSNFSNVPPASQFLVSPAAPQARISIVDAMPQALAAQGRGTAAVPASRVTIVPETLSETPKTSAVAKSDTVEGKEPTTDEAEATEIDPALKGLVGTWMAVARHGDGELTTVELQLDDRGWAKLTVPGADGKPSSIKRRVELDEKELKLTGPDANMSLGKLIEFNSRQMVLASAEGQMTFVRP